MFEDGAREHFAFVVGQKKLLGEIGEDAQAIGPGVDHEVDAALLAVEVEFAAFGEGRWHDGEQPLVAGGSVGAHVSLYSMMSKSLRNSVLSVRPRPGLLSSSCRKPFSAT